MKQKLQIHLFLIVLLASTTIFLDINQSEWYKVLKPVTTLSILALALIYPLDLKPGTKGILVGALTACLAGDICLMFDGYFIAGVLFFLLGHILFIWLISKNCGWQRYLVPLVVLALIAGCYFYFIKEQLGDMRIPVFAYMVVIVVMSWQAIAAFLKGPRSSLKWLALGAIFFFLSDSILAYNKFVSPISYSSLWILATYYAALTLMTYTWIDFSRKSYS